jgi:pimeloyl-ACP methyl ester carboxylesterase
MSATKEDTLRVAGTTLFYRVTGSGPTLLMLPGGHADADTAKTLCEQLVDNHVVVTYDRRRLSRSKIDRPVDSLTLATHSDDAHCPLGALTNEPALVFGSSMGALIGLDLVTRHPEQVRILVAHEPPAWDLLPNAERDQAM